MKRAIAHKTKVNWESVLATVISLRRAGSSQNERYKERRLRAYVYALWKPPKNQTDEQRVVLKIAYYYMHMYSTLLTFSACHGYLVGSFPEEVEQRLFEIARRLGDKIIVQKPAS